MEDPVCRVMSLQNIWELIIDLNSYTMFRFKLKPKLILHCRMSVTKWQNSFWVIMAQYFCKRSWSRFRLKKFEPEPGSFLTEDRSCQGSLFFGIIANSLLSCMRFRDWILIMYVCIMYIMCLIVFEEKEEIHDQYP